MTPGTGRPLLPVSEVRTAGSFTHTCIVAQGPHDIWRGATNPGSMTIPCDPLQVSQVTSVGVDRATAIESMNNSRTDSLMATAMDPGHICT